MWGAILGAASGVAGSIFGAVKANKAAKKAKQELQKQEAQNEAIYNRRHNEDYLNTATAQRALSQAREEGIRQVNRARGIQAVMGGSDESVAMAQRSANAMLADTESQLAAQGQARKDSIEQQYLQRAQDISNRYMQMYNAQSQNIANAAGQVAQGGFGLALSDLNSYAQTGKGIFGDLFKKSKSNFNLPYKAAGQ